MSRGAGPEYRFERATEMAASIADEYAVQAEMQLGTRHPLARQARMIAFEIRHLNRHQPEGFRRKIERGASQ